METAAHIKTEYQQVREHCGYTLLPDWCLIQAEGKDLFGFLQTQATSDVTQLAISQGQNSAIVDRKARLLAAFSIHRSGGHSAIILIESQIRETFLKHLETYRFREEFTAQPLDLVVLTLQGPKSAIVLQSLAGRQSLPEKPNHILEFSVAEEKVVVINKSLTGEEGFVLGVRPDFAEEFVRRLQYTHPAPAPVGPEVFDILRIEAGIPLFNRDMDATNILPETGLEHSSVSYNKGCYIGQEVIARIKTYGAPNFALMGILFEEENHPQPDSTILLEGKKIGIVKSAAFSPSLGKNVALAYIQKDYRSPDVEWAVTIADRPFKIKTCLLPLYQAKTRRDHSKRLLDQALKKYKDEEDLDKPIALLREALDLDPKHAAAYEALGVLLSKQDKIEEAIALMKRLVEIDPNEIMAHTNLSIYYMKQGRIEDAEQEKGEATALEFEKLVMQNMAKKKKRVDDENTLKEQERKIEMFKKVLEIDPVDQIANFGLGSIHLEKGQYEDALEPLQTVIKENKDYSAAYLLLGKTREKLSQPEEAIKVYRAGIAAASKKGDLMPLKDMQNRLNQMLHSEP